MYQTLRLLQSRHFTTERLVSVVINILEILKNVDKKMLAFLRRHDRKFYFVAFGAERISPCAVLWWLDGLPPPPSPSRTSLRPGKWAQWGGAGALIFIICSFFFITIFLCICVFDFFLAIFSCGESKGRGSAYSHEPESCLAAMPASDLPRVGVCIPVPTAPFWDVTCNFF